MRSFDYPCKECTKRHVGCHSKCNDYIEMKRVNNEITAQQFKNSRINDALHDLGNNRLRSLRRGHK